MSERLCNLLDQPWIPVTWECSNRGNSFAENMPGKVSIRRALADAPKIRSVSHTSPFVEFGLYRLLITIVLDAYILEGQRPTIDKMRRTLGDRQFAGSVLSNYWRSYSAGFDLWAEQNPFLQRNPAIHGAKKSLPKSVVTMFPAMPSGTNVAYWHHFAQDESTFSDELAAQVLTTISPFNFKVKPGEARTLAGDPPMYVLVLGDNLFETIVLNLPRPTGRTTKKQENENGPAWRTPLELGNLPKVPTIAQGFTWPVRIIKLEQAKTGVAEAINRAAYKKPTEKAKGKSGNLYDPRYGWRDPNAGTQTAKDRVIHVKARPGVPVWRDAVPLFLVASEGDVLHGDRRRSRPEVVSNALRILDTPEFRVAVYGMRKKGGGGGDVKVEEWFRTVLILPTEVARDSRLSARAIAAFKTTQKVADALGTALRMLRAPSGVKKTRKQDTYRAEADQLAQFWQNLELCLTRDYLKALGGNDPKSEQELRGKIRREARDGFARATGPHRRTADGLFRIANASNWFERRLAKLLLSQEWKEKNEQR